MEKNKAENVHRENQQPQRYSAFAILDIKDLLSQGNVANAMQDKPPTFQNQDHKHADLQRDLDIRLNLVEDKQQ
jgi:hypothetical protein